MSKTIKGVGLNDQEGFIGGKRLGCGGETKGENRGETTGGNDLTGSAVFTHDVTTGTGYCLIGFSWIIDVLNQPVRHSFT